MLAEGVPTLVAELLDRVYLALILDLDETLLVANSASTIENRMESCRRARWDACLQTAGNHGLLLRICSHAGETACATLQSCLLCAVLACCAPLCMHSARLRPLHCCI